MSDPQTTTVDLNGFQTRIWTKGSGPKVGFLAGYGGLPRWTPFLEELSRHRTVVAPSLPGFPGGDRGHTALDSHLDWVVAVRELLSLAGLTSADLIGSSVGGSLAAEAAALWPDPARKLVLLAPWGLYDESNPPTDPWAQRGDAIPGLMCANPDNWTALKAPPENANSIEFPIEQVRANEAAARIFWPLGNTRLEKRLRLITSPTLLLWGENDRVMPPAYAAKFAAGIAGPVTSATIGNAGHLAELDQPAETARRILSFLGS